MAEYSGQKTVSAAGTAERLHSDLPCNGPLLVKALSGNSGDVYLGNVSGDVSSTNGLVLDAGEEIYFSMVHNLREIWLDVGTNDDGVAFMFLRI